MKLSLGTASAIFFGFTALTVGCTAVTPTPTSQAPVAGVNGQATADAPNQYQLQSVVDDFDVAGLEAIVNDLPASIAAADADRLLETIGRDQVKSNDATYSLQNKGGSHRSSGARSFSSRDHGSRVFSGRHLGLRRGGILGNRFFGSNFFFDNDLFYNPLAFRFLRSSNYMFPYFNAGSAYHPYTLGSYLPFLAARRAALNPFALYNPLRTWPWLGRYSGLGGLGAYGVGRLGSIIPPVPGIRSAHITNPTMGVTQPKMTVDDKVMPADDKDTSDDVTVDVEVKDMDEDKDTATAPTITTTVTTTDDKDTDVKAMDEKDTEVMATDDKDTDVKATDVTATDEDDTD